MATPGILYPLHSLLLWLFGRIVDLHCSVLAAGGNPRYFIDCPLLFPPVSDLRIIVQFGFVGCTVEWAEADWSVFMQMFPHYRATHLIHPTTLFSTCKFTHFQEQCQVQLRAAEWNAPVWGGISEWLCEGFPGYLNTEQSLHHPSGQPPMAIA